MFFCRTATRKMSTFGCMKLTVIPLVGEILHRLECQSTFQIMGWTTYQVIGRISFITSFSWIKFYAESGYFLTCFAGCAEIPAAIGSSFRRCCSRVHRHISRWVWESSDTHTKQDHPMFGVCLFQIMYIWNAQMLENWVWVSCIWVEFWCLEKSTSFRLFFKIKVIFCVGFLSNPLLFTSALHASISFKTSFPGGYCSAKWLCAFRMLYRWEFWPRKSHPQQTASLWNTKPQ